MKVGPTKEAWSSILLRHLEGLQWLPLELTLRVREGTSKWGSFPALSVEDDCWGRDMGLTSPLLWGLVTFFVFATPVTVRLVLAPEGQTV